MADVVFRYLIGNHLEAFWEARTAPLCQCFALISYCGALKKKLCVICLTSLHVTSSLMDFLHAG